MMVMLNGQERTLEEFVELGDATGWKLEVVDRHNAVKMCSLVFVPS